VVFPPFHAYTTYFNCHVGGVRTISFAAKKIQRTKQIYDIEMSRVVAMCVRYIFLFLARWAAFGYIAIPLWMGCIYVNDLEHIEHILKVTLTERAKFQFTKFTYFCP